MNTLEFLVQGSSSQPYNVIFIIAGKNLTARCTCPAGEFGQYCKHRIDILKGETKDIISNNSESVKTVQSWLPETDVEKALNDVFKTEKDFNAAKKRLSVCKKILARALLD